MDNQLTGIGIYGGSFDPIHYGHLIAAQNIADQLGLEKVFFLPANHSPLKSQHSSSAHDRLQMTRLAVSGNPLFEVSSYEIDKGGTSYTVDTLRYFKQLYADCKLFLLLGADSISTLDKWREYQLLPQLCSLAVASRPDAKSISCPVLDLITVRTPLIDISSTMIRNRVNRKLKINYLVPPVVMDYILANKLYSE